jgi:hypothetical protein
MYSTDTQQSVEKALDPFASSVQNTPILDATSSISSEAFSQNTFNSNIIGYRFIKETSRDIDAEENGPNTIDSLAISPETP